jgi:hypothetical protein
MSRRGAGICFIAISAFLFAARFLSAAIWGAGVTSWNAELFRNMLGYVDQGLTIASLVALGLGIFYLAWAEIRARGE